MADDKKDNPDIYSLRDPATLTEKVIIPSDNTDIFAIKNEETATHGSIIGVTLDAGVFLCNAYRLDKRLSQDERGEIWKASDLHASRNVILYLPPRDIRNDTSAMEPVKQAARHAEALEHPRIVPFLDNFTDPEHGFFSVRKLINGKTLDLYRKDYIHRHKKFAPTKTVKILSDTAHALDYAHSVDVLHGDLCPKNIIVGLDDEVYVDNFALLPFHTMEIAGNKPYLAPEIIEGHAPSVLSDIYALAVVAYELLAGHLPSSPETINDIPPPIPGVPSTVDAVIRKAMARDPDDRYSSCGELVKALEKSFQESAKITSVAITPSSKQRTNIAAHPLFWATLLGFLVAGVGVIWVLQSQNLSPVSDEIALKQPFEDASNQDNGGLSNKASDKKTLNQNNGVTPHPHPHPHPLPKGEGTLSSDEGTLSSDEGTLSSGESHEPDPSKTDDPPLTAEPEQNLLAPEPIENRNDQAQAEQTEANDQERLPDNDSPPAERPEEPPLPNTGGHTDVAMENPQPDNPSQDHWEPSDSDESKRVASLTLADIMREEGETTQIVLDGVEYHFRWCKGELGMETGGFWIQETLVTQEMWKAVMKTIPEHNDYTNPKKQPVVYVSWKDCEKFMEGLHAAGSLDGGEFVGYRFSLPTESQWKYATAINANIDEWCHDWHDDAKNTRVINGSRGRNSRYPDGRHTTIGFRLVIVRDKLE